MSQPRNTNEIDPPSAWDAHPHWKREGAAPASPSNQGQPSPELLKLAEQVKLLGDERDHWREAWSNANNQIDTLRASVTALNTDNQTLVASFADLAQRVRDLELRNAAPTGEHTHGTDDTPPPTNG